MYSQQSVIENPSPRPLNSLRSAIRMVASRMGDILQQLLSCYRLACTNTPGLKEQCREIFFFFSEHPTWALEQNRFR